MRNGLSKPSPATISAGKSYVHEYGSRFLAIGVLENHIKEERAKIMPSAARIKEYKGLIEYLKTVRKEDLFGV